MSETDYELTPQDIANISKEAESSLPPTKSGIIYEAAYQRFVRWCNETNVESYSEEVLLEYFYDLEHKQKMKSSTMWSQYSMIKSIMNAKHGVDISEYLKLRAYLKEQNKGYVPKKTKVFTNAQFQKFLVEAPDDQYLAMKVIMMIGIFGACRCDEMVRMTVDDIEDFGTLLHVKIPDSSSGKARTFTVAGENYVNIYKKYILSRPMNMKDPRLFLKFTNGKCYRMVMGIHTISAVPKRVASYLKLPDAKDYTGHCLRRTSATFM